MLTSAVKGEGSELPRACRSRPPAANGLYGLRPSRDQPLVGYAALNPALASFQRKWGIVDLRCLVLGGGSNCKKSQSLAGLLKYGTLASDCFFVDEGTTTDLLRQEFPAT